MKHMATDWDYENQFQKARLVVAVDLIVAVAIGIAVVLEWKGTINVPIVPFPAGQLRVLLLLIWAISAALMVLYGIVQVAIRAISPDKSMRVLRFWVRQLHRAGRTSAISILLVPPSIGEATVILSALLYVLGGSQIELFFPGAVVGVLEIVASYPGKSVRDKLIILDQRSN